MSYPTPTSPNYASAIAFMRAANERDYAAMETLLADGFSYQVWPSSHRQPGMEKRLTKREYIDRARELMDKVIDELAIDLEHPVNVVEGEDCIVLQLSSDGKLKSGAPWAMEYCQIIRFDAEGKIVANDSWNDSAYAQAAFKDAAVPKFAEDGRVTNLAEVTGADRGRE